MGHFVISADSANVTAYVQIEDLPAAVAQSWMRENYRSMQEDGAVLPSAEDYSGI